MVVKMMSTNEVFLDCLRKVPRCHQTVCVGCIGNTPVTSSQHGYTVSLCYIADGLRGLLRRLNILER